MRLVSIRHQGVEQAGILTTRGIVTFAALNEAEGRNWPTQMLALIESGSLDAVRGWLEDGGEERLSSMPTVSVDHAERLPLYRRPRKIWGIGFNYAKNAEELKTIDLTEEPVGFMKPDTSLIGPGEPICLPDCIGPINAEAELAIVIGAVCKHVSEEDAPRFVAGFTTALDMTAADIHARNPRFLARAKSFDTFFSFGSELVTPDEIANVLDLKVSTILNGEIRHTNTVFNMRYRPWFAVAYHSQFMTLLPGDILLTGTPGSVHIRSGDTVECHIDGFTKLSNPVQG
ncbi:2-keto-4-pentenoate hydratase/2-oxohepta-3-ene-1,7-dioic acid hydratase in catechol pathway [Paenibacillus sp. DS2015]|uniref:fumarylacetoacetate hydrolase family protein n=1 Tax=Paenibacillus sp. DS2015 TaxID=3373917 RepID=UPI003D26030A